MPNKPLNTDAAIEQQIVAYLDGELDAESGRRIEQRIAGDRQLRERLHQLNRTWEVLDMLDTSSVSEDFTQTTMEMVAVAASDEVPNGHRRLPGRRTVHWAVIAGGLLAAGLAGFLTVAMFLGDQSDRVEKDTGSELAQLSNELSEANERIRQIEQAVQSKKPRAGKDKIELATRRDVDVLLRWLEQYAGRHAGEFLKSLPESRREKLAEMPEQMRRMVIARMVWQNWHSKNPGKPLPISDENLAELRRRLSDKTRERLEANSPKEQRRMISTWIRQALRRRIRPTEPPPRRPGTQWRRP